MEVILPSHKFAPLVTENHRYKVLFGGRGSGKSQTIAQCLIAQVAKHGRKVGCFREYQNSIDDSVYSLLRSEIGRMGVPGFTILGTEINHINGGCFRFRGLARNVESIKSMHDFDIFWLEEGQTISSDSLTILKPTLRKPGSEIWISLNPVSRQDAIAVDFILPFEGRMDGGVYSDPEHYVARVNHTDNRFFPDVLGLERSRDYSMLPRALYNHIWEGDFYDEVEGSIIKAEWFDAAIDAHKRLGFDGKGPVVVSHDPADSGDAKGLVCRHGVVVLDAIEMHDGTVNDGGAWALDYAISRNADAFIWDCDGLGIALQKQVHDALDGRKIQAHMYRGSGGVDRPGDTYARPDDSGKTAKNRDTFKNRRAQRYWELRDRFYRTWLAIEQKRYIDPDTLISINSGIKDINLLRSEVCRVPLKHNGLGLIQIMSKEDMKRIKIKSPNMADALKQSFDIPMVQTSYDRRPAPMEFDSLW